MLIEGFNNPFSILAICERIIPDSNVNCSCVSLFFNLKYFKFLLNLRINISSFTNNSAIFNAMSENERYEVWNNRFNYVKTFSCWNMAQKSAIIYFQNHFSIDIFNDDSTTADHNFDIFSINWLLTTQNLFSKAQQYMIIGTLETITDCDPSNLPNISSDGGGSKCRCSKGSDYCDFFSSNNLKCTNSIFFTASDRGCGTLWTKPCDGQCELFGIGFD